MEQRSRGLSREAESALASLRVLPEAVQAEVKSALCGSETAERRGSSPGVELKFRGYRHGSPPSRARATPVPDVTLCPHCNKRI